MLQLIQDHLTHLTFEFPYPTYPTNAVDNVYNLPHTWFFYAISSFLSLSWNVYRNQLVIF